RNEQPRITLHDAAIAPDQFHCRLPLEPNGLTLRRHVHYHARNGLSEKHIESWCLPDFIIMFRMAEELKTSAGVFYADVVGIAGHVLHDLQWQPPDILFGA